MKKLAKTNLLIILFLGLLQMLGFAQTSLNLFNLTVNDSIPLKGMDIAKITDIFGRPTVVKQPAAVVSNILGIELFYHELGLKFMFNPKSKDPEQRLMNVMVYFSQKWDKDNSKYFQPYSGNILPSLSPKLKSKDVVTLYEDKGSTVKLIPEPNFEVVLLTGIDFHIRHICEPITKYLEFISIVLSTTN
jgi:hypothetical protein